MSGHGPTELPEKAGGRTPERLWDDGGKAAHGVRGREVISQSQVKTATGLVTIKTPRLAAKPINGHKNVRVLLIRQDCA